MQFNMSTRCLRTVTVCFTMTFIQLDQMGHQTMGTVRRGAIIMPTVRDSLPMPAHVTLKDMNVGMTSMRVELFFTQKEVNIILK